MIDETKCEHCGVKECAGQCLYSEKKEIKPVGPERDVEIAKSKGYEILKYNSYLYPIYIRVPTQIKDFTGRKYTQRVRKLLPHWSTDRNAAWELWDELPLTKKIRVVKRWFIYNYQSGQFAEIVSAVWIEWKEQEKK